MLRHGGMARLNVQSRYAHQDYKPGTPKGARRWPCPFPGCKIVSYEYLDRVKHDATHKEWPCELGKDLCGKTFTTRSRALKHFQGSHNIKNGISCTFVLDNGKLCGVGPLTHQQMRSHRNRNHANAEWCPQGCGKYSLTGPIPQAHIDQCTGEQKFKFDHEKDNEKGVQKSGHQIYHKSGNLLSASRVDTTETGQCAADDADDDDADAQEEKKLLPDLLSAATDDIFLPQLVYTDKLCDLIEARNKRYLEAPESQGWPVIDKPVNVYIVHPELQVRVLADRFVCSGVGGKPCRHKHDRLTPRNSFLYRSRRKTSATIKPYNRCYLCNIEHSLLQKDDLAQQLAIRQANGLCVASVSCEEAVLPGRKRCLKHSTRTTEQRRADRQNVGLCIGSLSCIEPLLPGGDRCLQHAMIRGKADVAAAAQGSANISTFFEAETRSNPQMSDALMSVYRHVCEILKGFTLPPRWRALRDDSSLVQRDINCEFAHTAAMDPRPSLLCSVGITDPISGKVLLHCRLDHDGMSGDELLKYYEGHANYLMVYQIRSYYLKRDHPVALLTAGELFQELKRLDFRNCIARQWALYDLDVGLVEEYLNRNGFDASEVLPPPRNRFAAGNLVANELRQHHNATHVRQISGHGLPGLERTGLERLYYMLCPNGALHGSHHEADVDALKEGEVLKVLFEILRWTWWE